VLLFGSSLVLKGAIRTVVVVVGVSCYLSVPYSDGLFEPCSRAQVRLHHLRKVWPSSDLHSSPTLAPGGGKYTMLFSMLIAY